MSVLHSTLTGADLHEPKPHAASHDAGGADEISTLGDVVVQSLQVQDSKALILGTGGDATILYDGTDLIIDPQVVGAGAVEVQSILRIVAPDNNAVMELVVNDESQRWRFQARETDGAFFVRDQTAGTLPFLIEAGAPTDTLKLYSTGDVSIEATAKLFLDGGGDTYIHEGGANVVQLVVGGSGVATFTNVDFRLPLAGQRLFIGDTANADQTTGLTINQGAATDESLAVKNSLVAHGRTSLAETDTYFDIVPGVAGTGGAGLRCFAEDAALPSVFGMQAHGGTADTTKTTAAIGLFYMFAAEHDGAGSPADITANGNVFVVSARVGGAARALFSVDRDGDFHYDGADGGAFDEFDDAQLVRAFSLVTSRDPIRTEWDRFVEYGEAELVATGILGDTIENGGLVNGAQLQRLHTGAIWQMYTLLQEQAAQIADLKQRLLQGAG
jgi:hypothetical protein